jgi:hypothetical protein
MSESNTAHIGRVKSRWDYIRAEFLQLERLEQFKFVDWPFLWEIFDEREQRQLRPIHYLAQYLVPLNWQLPWFSRLYLPADTRVIANSFRPARPYPPSPSNPPS